MRPGIILCHKCFSLERLSLWKKMKGMTSPEALIWAGMKCGNVMEVEEHAGRRNNALGRHSGRILPHDGSRHALEAPRRCDQEEMHTAQVTKRHGHANMLSTTCYFEVRA
jgi:hypothetical protein